MNVVKWCSAVQKTAAIYVKKHILKQKGRYMKPKQKNTSLGEENINRLMLRFSIPCIMSLLISSLYNIVDQIFIGNSELSTLGNAATGVVFPVFIIGKHLLGAYHWYQFVFHRSL